MNRHTGDDLAEEVARLRANLQAAGDIVSMHSETIARLETELARLRRVKEAARGVVNARNGGGVRRAMMALHAALEEG